MNRLTQNRVEKQFRKIRRLHEEISYLYQHAEKVKSIYEQPDAMMCTVCEVMDLEPEEVTSRKRTAYLVDARRHFINLAYLMGLTQTQIARYLKLDHSTVNNARGQHKNLLYSDPEYRNIHDMIVRRFSEAQAEEE